MEGQEVVTGEIVEPKQRAVRVRELVVEGQQAWEYSDGSIRNYKGHPISGTKIPNEGHEITHDTARDLLSRRRLVGLRAQLRGLARAEGVDPSEIDDELLMQAGSAVEALTLHMAKTFKESKSLRGMSEAYGALISPLVGDKREREPIAGDVDKAITLLDALSDLARAVNNG